MFKTVMMIRVIISTAILLIAGSIAGQASAASVLVVQGSNGEQTTGAANLRTRLVARGDTVTTLAATPADLSAFTVIYDLRVFTPTERTPAVLAQYMAFLNQAPGNVLFLLGENSFFPAANQAISDFITLAGGGVVNPPATSSSAIETVAPGFRSPNDITTVGLNFYGVATSPGNGDFITTGAGGTTGSAIAFSPGDLTAAPGGALVVVYDINFLNNVGGTNTAEFFGNLINYVAVGAPPVAVAPVAVPTLSEWALILFGVMLAGSAALYIRQRRSPV